MNKQKLIYALAIIAHPDDEAFLLAGTCMKFAEEGKSVGVLCATHGEQGADRLHRDLTPEQMAEIRIAELRRACSMIHCDCLELLDYPDGGLNLADSEQLESTLIKEIEKYQPKIIFTFGPEGITGHKDHIAIGRAAQAAAEQAQPRPKEIWLVSIPTSLMSKFLEHLSLRKIHHNHYQAEELYGVPDERLVKIDIRKFAAAKAAALKAHESQYLSDLNFDIFLEYECFEVIKLN